MNNPTTEKTSMTQRSTTMRFLRWLFRPKTLGRIVCILLTLATLVALFYVEEDWRGRRAWERYQAEMTAKGIRLDWEAYIPPPVPDDQNFATTPFLAPVYDFLPGTQMWRDTNAFWKIQERIESPNELAKSMGFDLVSGNSGRWEKGEPTDFISLLGTNTIAERKLKQEGKVQPVPRPMTQEQAATRLLEIFKPTFDPVVNELREASRRPFCRFNLSYSSSSPCDILLPHLAVLKGLVRNLTWRASAELELGQTNAAFDDLLLGFYLSDTLRNEPFLISQLVRLANRNFLIQVIWNGLSRHQWSEAQLHRLEAGLAQDDFGNDAERALMAQRASGVRMIEQWRTESWRQTFIKMGVFKDDDVDLFKPVAFLMPQGWFYFEQVNLCRGYDRFPPLLANWQNGLSNAKSFMAAVDQVREACQEQTIGQSLWQHRWLERMLLPEAGGVQLKGVQAQVRSELSRTACILENYYLAKRSYPESLETLVPQFMVKAPIDLMSGKPLLYRRDSSQSFVLYSVGRNLKDDAGTVVLSKSGFINIDQGDWVWRQPGK